MENLIQSVSGKPARILYGIPGIIFGLSLRGLKIWLQWSRFLGVYSGYTSRPFFIAGSLGLILNVRSRKVSCFLVWLVNPELCLYDTSPRNLKCGEWAGGHLIHDDVLKRSHDWCWCMGDSKVYWLTRRKPGIKILCPVYYLNHSRLLIDNS